MSEEWYEGFSEEDMVKEKERINRFKERDKTILLKISSFDGRHVANVGSYAQSFDNYAQNFYNAFEATYRAYGKLGEPVEFYAYAIIFNARHAVELLLKDNISKISRLDKKYETGKIVGHCLKGLWEEVSKLMLSVDKRLINSFDNKKVGQIIKDLSAIDGNGEIFRYPVNRDYQVKERERGEFNHLVEIEFLDIQVFYQGMHELFKEFEKLENMIEYIDIENDF